MSCLISCCSCVRTGDADNPSEEQAERQSLMQAKSARKVYRSTQDVAYKSGKIFLRHVGVLELDRRFMDIADTFNKQQEHHQSLTEKLRLLKECYKCSPASSFSECFHTIREQHSAFSIDVQMSGYDFSATVQPENAPAELKSVQEHVKCLSQDSKLIMAAGPKLQEMISSMLQNEHQITEMVQKANQAYQEQLRYEANLQDNFQEIHRARELSTEYRVDASNLLTEFALLAGVSL
ncbi:uncharacterized protein si:ch73-345f18.3 [Erpetoichthys calabaricus]|uniref:uncharacterized protein si:ch73-345f18.3 n=1 Tax=Erpetoichthys calabaricus TaxID=27687 RepID=UPI0010A0324A|nr:uncharacterized protein si:ch73-345f18.3 [Erpetoichthys calabaricus]